MSTLYKPFVRMNADQLQELRATINSEVQAGKKARTQDYVTDTQAELLGLFMDIVSIPVYRVPIMWNTLDLGPKHVGFGYNPGYGLSTSENNTLTRLVIAAHDLGVQVRITPRSNSAFNIHLSWWPKWEGEAGRWNGMHPNLEEAIRAYGQGEYVPQDGKAA